MARMADARAQYAQNMVTTTPERLVTMLYDRMVRDLIAAEQAIADGDREIANREIQHAQLILIELLNSLDEPAWPAAGGLSALYSWMIEQLLQANLHKDAAPVRACRELVEPLAEAWHQAAGRSAAQQARPASPLSGSVATAV
jgi:flagellar protein FliS